MIADDPSRYQALLTQTRLSRGRGHLSSEPAWRKHVPTRPIDKRSPRRTWSGSLSPCSRLRRSDAVTGSLDPGEECDDGNLVDTDRCDRQCRRRAAVTGWSRPAKPAMTATSATMMPALAPSVLRLDAVTGTCRWASSDVMRVKPTVMCHPIPAARTAAYRVAGDGVVDEGEACDDGNLVADDGCGAVPGAVLLRWKLGRRRQPRDACMACSVPARVCGRNALYEHRRHRLRSRCRYGRFADSVDGADRAEPGSSRF